MVRLMPSNPIDELFGQHFVDVVAANIALAKAGGFCNIPCYEFRWSYEWEPPNPPQHRATLEKDGDKWKWVRQS